MLDVKAYLDSGIIEIYCLGAASPEEAQQLEAYVIQYPEIKQALETAQDTLLRSLNVSRREAPLATEQKILDAIAGFQLDKLELSPDTGLLAEFVNISPQSDPEQWKSLIREVHPPEDFEIHVHPLFESDERQLYIVWFKDELPDEAHDDLLESVLVLEGTCIGKMNGEEYPLGPGDYFQIPLQASHTLKVTSKEPIKLILSRVLVA